MGGKEGADFRDAYWRRRHHAVRPQPSEAGTQGAVPRTPVRTHPFPIILPISVNRSTLSN